MRAQLRAPRSGRPRCSKRATYKLDLRTRRVVRAGREVHLTAREFELLAYLARHPDQVLSREQILNAVWGFDFDPGTKVLEVYIGYLRRKLGEVDGAQPIETVRNVGYRLCTRLVARRLLPGSLRAQLALAIALVTLLTVGLTFVAVYQGTGSRLRDRIDEDLTTQVAEWEQLRAGSDLSTPQRVERIARRYIDSQSYHPASRVFIVDVAGGQPVTNESRILERELERKQEHAPGEEEEAGEEDGSRIVYSVRRRAWPRSRSRRQGSCAWSHGLSTTGAGGWALHVADPLTPVEDAQESLRRTFAVAGSLALLLAVAAGVWIATLIARPLRRMAGVAAAVDSGDLSRRAGSAAAREVGALAAAFDRMLERLERTFERQRDFVSDASHELRTPLAVVRAQVELLDRETDERARHEGTARLLRRLDELDRLVGDMLALASAEAGRLIRPQPLDLGGLLRGPSPRPSSVRRARLPHRDRRRRAGGRP